MDADELIEVFKNEKSFIQKKTRASSSALMKFRHPNTRMFAEIDSAKVWFEEITVWPAILALEYADTTVFEYPVRKIIKAAVDTTKNGSIHIFINQAGKPRINKKELHKQIAEFFEGE